MADNFTSPSPPTAPPPVPPPDPTPAGTPADETDGQRWIEVEGLGLRFLPPQPAFGKAETVDGVLRYEVVDGNPESRWWLRFQALSSSRAGLTAKNQLDDYLETLRKNDKPFTVRLDETLAVEGASGEGRLLLLESPVGEGLTGISGWVVVPNGTDRFLTCSIVASTADLEAVLPQLRATFRSMQLRPPERITAERRERIDRGQKILGFGERELRGAIAAEPVVYRMYRPAAAGGEETELGWMSVRVIEGMRGEVDASREASSLRGEDAERGLLAIVQAKSIVNGDPTNTADTEIRSWTAWNRTSEVWSVRSTQRQKEAMRTSAQTGVRTPARPGDPRPMLRVINSSADRRSRDPLEWVVPPNYLSQTELIVLGTLLPKDDPAPPTFASYAFDPRSDGLPQRLDTWRRNPDGTWTLESKIGGATTPLTQTFDAKGVRIRRSDPDATGTVITERIDPRQLDSLWRRKGLPIQ
jgi:hypothetical protein